MARDIKQVIFDDFSGGMVDSLPSDMLQGGQHVLLQNVLPLDGGDMLAVRPGFKRKFPNPPTGWNSEDPTADDPTRSIVGQLVQADALGNKYTIVAVSNGTDAEIVYWDSGDEAWVEIGTITGAMSHCDAIAFCSWDLGRFFVSDSDELWTADMSDADPSSTWKVVRNYNAPVSYDNYDNDADWVTAGQAWDNSDAKYDPLLSSVVATFDTAEMNALPGAKIAAWALFQMLTNEHFFIKPEAASWTESKDDADEWTTTINVNPGVRYTGFKNMDTGETWGKPGDNTTNSGAVVSFAVVGHPSTGQLGATKDWVTCAIGIQNGENFVNWILEQVFPKVYGMEHMVQHRGRLWGCKGNTVYFCGTDDDTRGDGQPRWTNWSPLIRDPQLDPNGTIVIRGEVSYDDGSSMDIAPYNEKVVGLGYNQTGLLVFKERSVSIWTYPDEAAPFEVDQGASIDVIAPDTGCVDAESISYLDSVVYFVGTDEGKRWSVYTVVGNEVREAENADNVRNLLAEMKDGGNGAAEVYSRKYYLASGSKGIGLVFDIDLGAWYAFATESEVNFNFIHGNNEPMMTMTAADGFVYSYPSDLYYDEFEVPTVDENGIYTFTDANRIPVRIRTRDTRLGEGFTEGKLRALYVDAGAKEYGGLTINVLINGNEDSVPVLFDIDTGATEKWLGGGDESDRWDEQGDVWGSQMKLQRMTRTLNYRCEKAALEVVLAATSRIQLNRLGFGYRTRGGKTNVGRQAT